MLRTRDGYEVALPRFRVRRLQRRLRTRGRHDPQWRSAARMFDLLIRRARCAPDLGSEYPVFTTRLGRRPVRVITRRTAPRRVEVLYIGFVPRP